MFGAVRDWRAKDGALKLTRVGLASDRAAPGSVTVTVRRAPDGLFEATIPTRTHRGAPTEEMRLALRASVEEDVARAAERWLELMVRGAWSDGAAAIFGEASADAWARDVEARRAKGQAALGAEPAARMLRSEAA